MITIGAKRRKFLFTYILDDLVNRPDHNAFQMLISHELNLNRGGLLQVIVADGHIATPTRLGQRLSEEGWPVPFFTVFRFPVIA